MRRILPSAVRASLHGSIKTLIQIRDIHWIDFYTCFAYASTYQYDKENEAATTTEERTINFEVRYCGELKDLDSTHFRVAFHGDSYDIQTVDFMNYQKKTIRIVCKLQKKGGA